MRPIWISLALACLALPAPAQEMRPQEEVRLAALDETAGRALRAALAGGSRGDVDLLQEAMAGTPLAPIETTLAGDWSCRTLKLGGLTPLTAYAAFDCRITADGDGFTLEKLTGSQRTTGRISARDGTMVYLGNGFVEGTDPIAYDDLDPDFPGDGSLQPQVGLVEQPGPDRIRILFPAPVVESDLDILYLTR